MKMFLYKISLLFQSWGVIVCQTVDVPTFELKKRMVVTRRKLNSRVVAKENYQRTTHK